MLHEVCVVPDALYQTCMRLYQVCISLMYHYQELPHTGLIYQPDTPRVKVPFEADAVAASALPIPV